MLWSIDEQQKQLLNFSPSPAKGRIASSTTAFRAKLAAPVFFPLLFSQHLSLSVVEVIMAAAATDLERDGSFTLSPPSFDTTHPVLPSECMQLSSFSAKLRLRFLNFQSSLSVIEGALKDQERLFFDITKFKENSDFNFRKLISDFIAREIAEVSAFKQNLPDDLDNARAELSNKYSMQWFEFRDRVVQALEHPVAGMYFFSFTSKDHQATLSFRQEFSISFSLCSSRQMKYLHLHLVISGTNCMSANKASWIFCRHCFLLLANHSPPFSINVTVLGRLLLSTFFAALFARFLKHNLENLKIRIANCLCL
jgi:hypothetical protein